MILRKCLSKPAYVSTSLTLSLAAATALTLGFTELDAQTNPTIMTQEAGSTGARAPRTRPQNSNRPLSTNAPGGPVSGLTPSELADFLDGQAEFESADTPASGLGPIFNDVSRAACHSVPATGGGSTKFVTRFGHADSGGFDPLLALGGSLLQSQAIDPAVKEAIPPQANVSTHRITTPLFGAGLIEAIPDSAILQNANASKPDGVSGKASVVFDVASGQTRMGRFGWKAQQATLLAFAADAYVNEMGITNRLFPRENAPNGNLALLAQYDTVADPEDVTDPATGKADIDRFADFMRYLAPVAPAPLSDSARIGALVFATTGCGVCHQPLMLTGRNPVSVLDRKLVFLFSDLLLHDMGSLADGIAQGTAGPRDFRTAPLWGLRLRTAFLHDGRAASVDAAIRAHDGEAARARGRYVALPTDKQAHLLDFLNAL